MLRVSVIIPAYNAAAFLPDALASIARQTVPPHEVIVIDDMSQDDSREVAAAAGVTVLSTGSNAGPSRARNLGVQHATGEILGFLDADDHWDTNMIECMLTAFSAVPSAAVAFPTRGHVFTGDQTWQWERPQPIHQPLELFWDMLRYSLIPCSGSFVRRDVFLALGGFDEVHHPRYSEDYDLWLRITRKHVVVATDQATLWYRISPGQLTSNNEKMARHGWLARWRALERESSGENQQRMVSLFRAAWEREIRDAWSSLSRPAFDEVMRQAPRLSLDHNLLKRWKVRRALWPAWWLLRQGSNVLPSAPRKYAKKLLSRVRGDLDGHAEPKHPGQG